MTITRTPPDPAHWSSMPWSRDGCQVCANPDTVTVCGCCGRRCGAHPHRFFEDTAVRLALVDVHAALTYVRWAA